MLLGQNLGGGEHGGLQPIGRGDPHGTGGNCGFATAHITLYQPCHRHTAAEIGQHFAQDAPLGISELEGQATRKVG